WYFFPSRPRAASCSTLTRAWRASACGLGALLAHCWAWANPLTVDQLSTTRTEAPSPDPNEPPGVGQPDEGAEATAPGTDLPASDGGLEAETESPDQPDDAEPGAQDDAALDSEDDEIVLEAVLTPSLAELYADPPPPEL